MLTQLMNLDNTNMDVDCICPNVVSIFFKLGEGGGAYTYIFVFILKNIW